MADMVREDMLVELLGAMIALGRACEGNQNRPEAGSHNALLSALYLTVPGTGLGARQQDEALRRLRAEKKKLVPRCDTCEKQCGRNDEYSVYELDEDGPQMTVLRETLLTGLLSFEPLLRGNVQPKLYEDALAFLYDGLYWLGHDCEPEELVPVLQEMLPLKARLLDDMLNREAIVQKEGVGA